MSTWEGLSPPYRTIVADPPWRYEQGGPHTITGAAKAVPVPPYSTMTVDEVADLPVRELADTDAVLFLWTTNRYLADTFSVARSWGFRHSQTLTWCKPPHGLGPGGVFANTSEFVLFCRRGKPRPLRRCDSTWFAFPRRAHSVKPPEFMDIVESVSPGPYVELFARAPRLGWDSWGYGYETAVAP